MNRTRRDIAIEILETSLNGLHKTTIMHNVHLSYDQLTRHLVFLLDLKLLKHENHLYITTEKGQRYIVLLKKISELERRSRENE